MKISEVVSLLKAGYTKKEIDELRNSETVTENTSESLKVEEPEIAPAVNASAAAATPATPAADNTEVLKAIENLTRVIQSQNIKNDGFDPVKKETAIDILGSIINNPKERSN